MNLRSKWCELSYAKRGFVVGGIISMFCNVILLIIIFSPYQRYLPEEIILLPFFPTLILTMFICPPQRGPTLPLPTCDWSQYLYYLLYTLTIVSYVFIGAFIGMLIALIIQKIKLNKNP